MIARPFHPRQGNGMTDARWHKNIVKRKSLTVTMGKGFDGSSWERVLQPAMDVMNKQMKAAGIDVVFSKADLPINAHIIMDTKPGNSAHGEAEILPYKLGGKNYIEKVTIKVPATPRIDENDAKSRQVGDGVKLYILCHEFVHCFGLENGNHTGGDVFSEAVQMMVGKTPADDKVQFDASSPAMPPVIFSAATITKIQEAWPKPPPPAPEP